MLWCGCVCVMTHMATGGRHKTNTVLLGQEAAGGTWRQTACFVFPSLVDFTGFMCGFSFSVCFFVLAQFEPINENQINKSKDVNATACWRHQPQTWPNVKRLLAYVCVCVCVMNAPRGSRSPRRATRAEETQLQVSETCFCFHFHSLANFSVTEVQLKADWWTNVVTLNSINLCLQKLLWFAVRFLYCA